MVEQHLVLRFCFSPLGFKGKLSLLDMFFRGNWSLAAMAPLLWLGISIETGTRQGHIVHLGLANRLR